MLGRMNLAQLDATGVAHDAPEAQMAAVMVKLDQVIDRINAITAAVEGATGGDTLFGGLDTAAIKASIAKITLTV